MRMINRDCLAFFSGQRHEISQTGKIIGNAFYRLIFQSGISVKTDIIDHHADIPPRSLLISSGSYPGNIVPEYGFHIHTPLLPLHNKAPGFAGLSLLILF
jgi:hypothetical protein